MTTRTLSQRAVVDELRQIHDTLNSAQRALLEQIRLMFEEQDAPAGPFRHGVHLATLDAASAQLALCDLLGRIAFVDVDADMYPSSPAFVPADDVDEETKFSTDPPKCCDTEMVRFAGAGRSRGWTCVVCDSDFVEYNEAGERIASAGGPHDGADRAPASLSDATLDRAIDELVKHDRLGPAGLSRTSLRIAVAALRAAKGEPAPLPATGPDDEWWSLEAVQRSHDRLVEYRQDNRPPDNTALDAAIDALRAAGAVAAPEGDRS